MKKMSIDYKEGEKIGILELLDNAILDWERKAAEIRQLIKISIAI